MEKLEAYRGDTYPILLTITEDDEALNLTGWTVFLTVKENEDDLDANAKISKTNTVHAEPLAGKTRFVLTATDTAELAGIYYFDVQVKRADGTIFTAVKGIINFSKDITRRVS